MARGALLLRLLAVVAALPACRDPGPGGVSSGGPPPAVPGLARCGPEPFHNPFRTGGAWYSQRCYAPPGGGACGEPSDPALVTALGGEPTALDVICLASGPNRERDAGTDVCCYSFRRAGEGRPFVVSGRPVVATLARRAWA